MPAPDRHLEEPPYPLPVRLKRAVFRRLPWLHIAWNWVRARLVHHWTFLRQRFRPRGGASTLGWLAGVAATIRARRREPRLTVAVDVASFWEELTGIGWYLYRILDELRDRDDVRIRLYGRSVVESPDLPPPVVEPPRGPALEMVSLAVPENLSLESGVLVRRLRALEPLLIALDGNRVVFAPNFFLPRRFALCRGARVATIHDLGLERVPETLQDATRRELAERLEHAVYEADRLITVSRTVRRELLALGYAAPGRVHAVHHGPGHLARVEAGEPPSGLPPRYALHVGTLEPRKNIGGLLDAWRALRRRDPRAPHLVLCGRYGWQVDALRREVERGRTEGWLVHLGYVSDGELAALYRGAEVVVFPSLYEGFGLPAVEAQWAGTPLVCSDIPVLRETAGDGALFVPPDDPEAIAGAVERVLADPALRDELVRRGRARAGRLDWSLAAARTLAVWRAAAGEGPAGDPADGGEAGAGGR